MRYNSVGSIEKMFELTKSPNLYTGIAMPTRLSNYFIFCGDASEQSGGRHHCGAERGCKADEAHAAPENVYRAEGLENLTFFHNT